MGILSTYFGISQREFPNNKFNHSIGGNLFNVNGSWVTLLWADTRNIRKSNGQLQRLKVYLSISI